MTDVCSRLHGLFRAAPRLSFPFDAKCVPKNGIYILFEKGESGHGDHRIVRVGTHTGANQLRSRLRQHFIVENKERSIFRENAGRALLRRDQDPFIAQWELDLTTRAAKDRYAGKLNLDKQRLIERRVTEYMQASFTFVAFSVDDKEERLDLESKIISTVSLCTECRPSADWLGKYSPKEQIRGSGLWNVNELYKTPLSASGMETVERLIHGALQGR